MNYEFFVFADAAEKQRFDADPLRWCGTVTDPITRQRFRPTTASPQTTHAGVPYYFSSDETLQQFAAAPDSFAVMEGWMFSMPMRSAPAAADSAGGASSGSEH